MQKLAGLAIVALLILCACDPAVKDAAVKHEAPAAEIAWRDGDVAEAFAEASEAGRPVLLYWGAVWCPPCNELKAGLFHDASFVARTRDFVPVYLDGDSKGAQRWGEHFAIQGYPTMIVLRPDQTEITRLSGSIDPDEINQVLRTVQQNKATAAQILAQVESDPQRLGADDWALLAAYGWEVDANKLVASDKKVEVLRRLASAAPTDVLKRRFGLVALEAEAGEDAPAPAADRQIQIRALLAAILANPDEIKRNRFTLMYSGADVLKLAGGAAEEHHALEQGVIDALDRLYADESLSTDNRLLTVNTELDIHALEAAKGAPVPPALLEKVRQRVAWADSAARTPVERQAVISDAASLLEKAGDVAGAEKMLTAELKRSATPFYYMPDLAHFAEERGDKAKAIDWLKQGYETSTGTASRVQWGILYVQGVIRLSPKDSDAVEQTANRIIDELGQHPDSYHQRTRKRFEGLESDLRKWSAGNKGAAVLQRLQARMHEVCPKTQTSEEAREACGAWLAKI
jgi:protein disulfide-isomerase